MELESVNSILDQYYGLLGGDEKYNEALRHTILKKNNEPILYVQPIEAEDDLSYSDEQRQLSEILLDMYAISNSIVELKNTIQNTVQSLDDSLNIISSSMRKQREQAEDINVICGIDSPYTSTIPIYADNFTDLDAETVDNKTFGAAMTDQILVPYDIVSIAGNGYSGNSFVYNDNEFENIEEDRSIPSYIMDQNTVTAYEYSRLSTKSKEESVGGIINYDDKPVECVLLLCAEEPVCKAILNIDETDVCVEKIETSEDGLNFKTVSDRPTYINNTAQSYSDCDYIYGTPVLCFPYTTFIRFTLSCNTTTSDRIAIEKEDDSSEETTVVEYPNTYRKKITIREIELYSMEYVDCTIVSDEILNDCAIDKISLFASEYVPNHFPEQEYISYSLLINGQEYPIIPVNTGRDGTTVIKYSEETTSPNDGTTLIHETIKSVQVKIALQPYAEKETPYVSNLKLCIGKNTGDIYVGSVSG